MAGSVTEESREVKQEEVPIPEEPLPPSPLKESGPLSLVCLAEENFEDEVEVVSVPGRHGRRQSVGYTSITPREGWQPLRKEKKKKSKRCQTDDELLRPGVRLSTEQSRRKFRSLLRHSVTMEGLKHSFSDAGQAMIDLWRRIDHLLRFSDTVDSVTAESLLTEFRARKVETELVPLIFRQQLEALSGDSGGSDERPMEMERLRELREGIFNWLLLRHAPDASNRLAKRKRIQSSRFDPFRDPDPALVRFHQPETDPDAPEKEKILVGATAEKLVYFLTTHDTDGHWRMRLLRTSSYYTSTPTEFLSLLIRRFTLTTRQPEETPSQVAELKISVLHQTDILKSWIKMNVELVKRTRALQKLITNLAEHILYPVSQAAATNLMNYLTSITTNDIEPEPEPLPRHIAFPKIKKLPKGIKSFRDVCLNDIHPVEMARQLCLIDQELYQAIKPSELLHLNWTREKKAELSPNVIRMIHQFNTLGQWVITQIVTTTKPRRRLKYLERMIATAFECYQMGNFNGAMAVISGLKSNQVTRLKASWNELPSTSWDQWEEIVEIFKLDDQFAVLREKTLTTPLPNIPYLGMFLSSLTLREGESNYTEEGLINVPKLVYVASVIEQVQKHQKSIFPYQPYPFLKEFLRNLPSLSELGADTSKPIKRAQSLVVRAGSSPSLSAISPRQRPVLPPDFDDDDNETDLCELSKSYNEPVEQRCVVTLERKHSVDSPKRKSRFFFRAFGSPSRSRKE